MKEQLSYIGTWVTRDGYIRQEILPGGRYDEARGKRKSAFSGSYVIKGNHIVYKDDTGFSVTGDFNRDILYHGGHIFYREEKLENINRLPML
ncbi:Atu4866 domain-containing protein [Foetidibacter luteolus]|uniref:Atu4866 domain-containing protein n=1 Tax=Foetidibacter luteolus TaxID=2608880 RepID=UPI00129B470D|nr:Atu4866 domain-containing protein [Foetidibacter luteolus]